MPRITTTVVLGALLVAIGCSKPPEDYDAALKNARAAKDEMLRTSADSPVPPEKRTNWPVLNYYPIDESYRVPAALKPPATPGATITMPTSTGERREMRRAGTLEFSVHGVPLKLSAFADLESPKPDRLFVPFGDVTNGRETYPGGRYLDLDPTPTGLYEIDFNRAYNPYCAYNSKYDCPYPPPENRLKVEIRAGEKLPSVHG